MVSVQKRVGFAMGVSAFLVAVVNSAELTLESGQPYFHSFLSPYVYTLVLASVMPMLTTLRDSRISKIIQVLILLGLGLVATVLNQPGDLTGIILVAFGLALGVQYELLGNRFWPRLIGAVVLYGIFAVLAAGYLFKVPLITGLNYLIAAAGFLYLFWVVFAEEVRSRRRNEAKLRESELRFETVIKNSNIMATNQDQQLRYTWIYNPHPFLDVAGVVGKTDEQLFSPPDGSRLSAVKRRVVRTGAGVQEEFHARIEEKEYYFELTIEPLYDETGAIIGVNTASKDITERVLLRDRLVQSERFAAAGQLATYIAHEVNSPLQGITSLLAYLRKRYSSQADLRESLDLINDAFSSIGTTVKNLLDLNRPSHDRLENVDMNLIIKNTFALTASMLKQNRVGIDLALAAVPICVRARPQRLTQVFLNLINNSLEAMQPQEPPAGSKRNIVVNSRREGKEAVVHFSDSGPGFTEEGLRRAFDPFHSEKSRIGMGIGLSICLQILHSVGGTITADNAPSGGALFTIRLPVASPQVDLPSAAESARLGVDSMENAE